MPTSPEMPETPIFRPVGLVAGFAGVTGFDFLLATQVSYPLTPPSFSMFPSIPVTLMVLVSFEDGSS